MTCLRKQIFTYNASTLRTYDIVLQVTNLQQRKCSIMFELSCNLERVLEFFTRELPQAFLCGSEVNLVRLCEFMMFVLNHTASIAERQVGNHIFDSSFKNNY